MSSLVMCKLEKRPQVARCHLSTPEMRAYLSDAKKQVPYCDSAFLTQTKIKAEQGREHLPKKEESLTFFSCTVTTQLRQGFSECSYFLLGMSVISDTNLITLYNAILRKARYFLETRENIKISTHPFHHINLD